MLLPYLLMAQSPQPGGIAPDAVYIDMDEWYPFSEGLAAIKKGEKWAFIDTMGKIVIPWGKVEPVAYRTGMDVLYPKFQFGRVLITANGKYGFADTKGNIVVECTLGRTIPYQKDCYGNIYTFAYDGDVRNVSAVPYVLCIDSNGNEVSRFSSEVFQEHSVSSYLGLSVRNVNFLVEDRVWGQKGESREVVSGGTTEIKYERIFGWFNRNGNLVIDFQFHNHSNFSEGLAAVALKNEFGEEMWGYINRSGEVVIDFKFSKQPGDFHFGRAIVYPRDPESAGFYLAYINPHGEVIAKITTQNPLWEPTVNRLLDQYNHVLLYRNRQYHFIDSTLESQPYPVENIAAAVGLGTIRLSFPDYGFRNSQVIGVVGSGLDRSTGRRVQGLGYVNRNAELVIPFLFQTRNENQWGGDIHHEFFSHRAKATLTSEPKRTGYINERGVFVILKKEESQW